nr:DUF4421 domain-containing protein [Prevotella pallens]
MVGKNTTICLLLLLFVSTIKAENSKDTIPNRITKLWSDSTVWQLSDSIKHMPKLHLHQTEKAINVVGGIDTTYIEPQKYNFTVMLQNTNNFEMYALSSRENYHLTLAPEPTVGIGPYAGWRWLFLGYTLDIKHPFFNGSKQKRKEFDVSLYSAKIGIDLYYRKTGKDFKIRSLSLGKKIETHPMEGMEFDGVETTVKGFNIYYIFNHRRFSYPAAFSQSTIQRKSAGSPLIGIGYTKHTLRIDWPEFYQLVYKYLKMEGRYEDIKKSLEREELRYTNFTVSGGYAYNYVFARNWLLAGSAMLGFAYKHNRGKIVEENSSKHRIISDNIDFDGIVRFGLVWNNMKWYAGTSIIMHAFNYHRNGFSTTNLFGNMNIYVGMNFGKRGKRKKI